MPETTPSFLDTLRQSDLISKERIESFLGTLPADAPREGQGLARRFVEAKLLTKFQTDLLLKGRHKGFVLKGKYRILDLLGAGGMGRVFLCEDVHLHRKVAIKLLSTEQAKDASNVERFYREARAVAALEDPNIVRIHELDRNEQTPMMVMEYVDGISLHDLVLQRGPLTVEEATNFIAQSALGLQHAHEVGIIHRDIKPSNLLLDRKGVVKILDLGLARFSQNEKNNSLTEKFDSNSVLGTADYLAPEQAVDSSAVDIRADLYALGGTLFYLLTGEAPFTAPTVAEKLLAHQMKPIPSLRERRSEVSTKLEAIYTKLLAKNPADRYQTPEQLVAALSPFADAARPMKIEWDTVAETHPGKRSEPTPRSSHRRHQPSAVRSRTSGKRLWIVGGAVAVVAVAIVVLLTSGGSGEPVKVAENKQEPETPKQKVNEKPPVVEPLRVKVEKPSQGEVEGLVKPEEAIKHVKQKVTIEMTAHADFNPNKTTLFLNSEKDFKDKKNFSVVLFQKTAGHLYPETDFGELAPKFDGKRIRITGTVVDYKGRIEIILEQAGQLQFVNE